MSAPLRIDVLTLFPRMFDSPFAESIVARARQAGRLELDVHARIISAAARDTPRSFLNAGSKIVLHQLRHPRRLLHLAARSHLRYPRLEIEQRGKLLHAIGLLGEQPEDTDAVCVRQRLAKRRR